ncbi:centromere protein C isoform X3 [Latimeria chalumnae]|uniref:centromere protein C isoform X3 n=1 Tax=Latimeria chalumnae TaxID=7897 RepID=UPI00313B3C31
MTTNLRRGLERLKQPYRSRFCNLKGVSQKLLNVQPGQNKLNLIDECFAEIDDFNDDELDLPSPSDGYYGKSPWDNILMIDRRTSTPKLVHDKLIKTVSVPSSPVETTKKGEVSDDCCSVLEIPMEYVCLLGDFEPKGQSPKPGLETQQLVEKQDKYIDNDICDKSVTGLGLEEPVRLVDLPAEPASQPKATVANIVENSALETPPSPTVRLQPKQRLSFGDSETLGSLVKPTAANGEVESCPGNRAGSLASVEKTKNLRTPFSSLLKSNSRANPVPFKKSTTRPVSTPAAPPVSTCALSNAMFEEEFEIEEESSFMFKTWIQIPKKKNTQQEPCIPSEEQKQPSKKQVEPSVKKHPASKASKTSKAEKEADKSEMRVAQNEPGQDLHNEVDDLPNECTTKENNANKNRGKSVAVQSSKQRKDKEEKKNKPSSGNRTSHSKKHNEKSTQKQSSSKQPHSRKAVDAEAKQGSSSKENHSVSDCSDISSGTSSRSQRGRQSKLPGQWWVVRREEDRPSSPPANPGIVGKSSKNTVLGKRKFPEVVTKTKQADFGRVRKSILKSASIYNTQAAEEEDDGREEEEEDDDNIFSKPVQQRKLVKLDSKVRMNMRSSISSFAAVFAKSPAIAPKGMSQESHGDMKEVSRVTKVPRAPSQSIEERPQPVQTGTVRKRTGAEASKSSPKKRKPVHLEDSEAESVLSQQAAEAASFNQDPEPAGVSRRTPGSELHANSGDSSSEQNGKRSDSKKRKKMAKQGQKSVRKGRQPTSESTPRTEPPAFTSSDEREEESQSGSTEQRNKKKITDKGEEKSVKQGRTMEKGRQPTTSELHLRKEPEAFTGSYENGERDSSDHKSERNDSEKRKKTAKQGKNVKRRKQSTLELSPRKEPPASSSSDESERGNGSDSIDRRNKKYTDKRKGKTSKQSRTIKKGKQPMTSGLLPGRQSTAFSSSDESGEEVQSSRYFAVKEKKSKRRKETKRRQELLSQPRARSHLLTLMSSEESEEWLGEKSGPVKAQRINLSVTDEQLMQQEESLQVLPSTTPNVWRSKRMRVRPLEYWRGERVDYKLSPSGGLVVEGVLSPVGQQIQRRIKLRRNAERRREGEGGSSAVQNLSGCSEVESTSPVEVWDATRSQRILLNCMRSGNDCLFHRGTVEENNGYLLVYKNLDQPEFATGRLLLGPFTEKKPQCVYEDTISFFISKGLVEVSIDQTARKLRSGDFFFVPAGNAYSLRNLESKEAILIFTQLKGKRQEETE